ncbi:hypothetical protein HGO38_25730 [Rhizobium sp. CG5]|uniref:hypothetical protein n=1 Tax=Rhizobium sp. CG5 TaxID=2726076 RepID=UPI002033D56C|nr:hypothetical protein [Rhizobium sp. CG5]MCM2476853.1 hypothetical protein [Rhizobium sp. CG5]
MKLDPATRRDFHRIYAHHEHHSSADNAQAIEDALYEDVATCDSLQTARYRALTYKRVRNGYRLFFVEIAGINIIYAIYHQREDWQTLISDRRVGLDEV